MMTQPFDAQNIDFKARGLIDQIYNALAEAIVDGILHGGERLVETELQHHFRVSRSPIREALRKLERKGLVEINPRRGTFVKTVLLVDIENCFTVHAVLEGVAARAAYVKMTDLERSQLSDVFRELAGAAQSNDTELARQKVYQFHRTFIIASRNALLINILRNVPIHYTWKRFLWNYSKEDLESSAQRYEKLLGLFIHKESDLDELENSVKKQVLWAGKRFVAYLIEEGKIGQDT